jgi:hypothetical protein
MDNIQSRVQLLLLAGLLGLLGCNPKPTAEGLKVESLGKEPKFEFVYTPTAGKTYNLIITTQVNMDLKLSGSGQQSQQATELPPYEMVGRVVIQKVEENGNIHSRSIYDHVRVLSSRVSPITAGRYQEALRGMEGMTITTVSSPQGQILKTKVENAPQDANMDQVIHSAVSGANQAVLLFPKKPLGVGARWTGQTTTDGPYGLKVTSRTENQVLSWDGKVGQVKTKFEQKAPTQVIQIPKEMEAQMPKGYKQTMSLEGSGECINRFIRNFPMVAEINCTMSSLIGSNAEAGSQGFQTDTKMDIQTSVRMTE